MQTIARFFQSLLFVIFAIYQMLAQEQLNIQGMVESDDTVMVVKVNSNAMFTDVVGLDVFSHPAPGRGIGGSFYGGSIGVKAEGRQTALFGQSQNAWGVYATSEFGSAGYFRGGDGDLDIVLGGSNYAGSTNGDEGAIGISANKPSGDIWLISNDAMVLHLDKNDDENGHLIIRNGSNQDVLNVNESGFISFADGTLQTSAPFKTLYSQIALGTSAVFTLGVVGQWVALGDGDTFTKAREDTNIEVLGDPFATTTVGTGGSVSFAFRIDGSAGNLALADALYRGEDEEIFLKSVFTSLPAGTHNVQIFGRANNAPATLVRIDTDSQILIEETY